MDKHFIPIKNLNLTKLAVFLLAIIASWALLQGVVPEPYHDKLLQIFLFLSAVVGYVLNSYVPSRNKKENTNVEVEDSAKIGVVVDDTPVIKP
jgi:Mlc titration factor MtfA (ptsG expression regulator)